MFKRMQRDPDCQGRSMRCSLARGPGLALADTLDFQSDIQMMAVVWCGLQARALHYSAHFLGVPFSHPTFVLAIC